MIKATEDQHLHLQLETLEQRFMLAGNVEAMEAGRSLVINGDDQDNVVVVTQVNDNFAVIGVDTEISGADVSTSLFGIDIDVKFFDDISRDIDAKLKGGDDLFLLNGSFSGVDFGDILGSDISIDAAHINRDVKINTDGGRDFVGVLNAEIGRDLKINTGFGLEDVVVVGGAGAVTGLLSYTSEYYDEVLGAAGSLLGDLGFWEDGFLSDIDFEEVGEVVGEILGGVSIERDLKIFGGSSHDYIYVGGVEIGRDSIIETALGDDNVYFGVGAYVSIYGDFFEPSVDGGGGPYYINLSDIGVSGETSVGRNAQFITSQGEDYVMIGGGAGYEFFIPSYTEGFPGLFAEIIMEGGVQVGKDLKVNTGQHDDIVLVASNPIQDFDPVLADDAASLYDVVVGRDMKISTFEEDDIVDIGFTEFFDTNGDFFVSDSSFGGLLYVGRNGEIDTGTGKDELLMGIDTFFDDDWVAGVNEDGPNDFYLVHFGRDLEVRTGTHDDYFRVSDSPFFPWWNSSPGTLFVGRDMDVDVDGGNDTVLLAEGDDFDMVTSFEGFESADIYVGDDLDVQTGNQDDQVSIRYTIVMDDTEIETSFGRDYLSISDSYLGDKVDIGTGAERDTVGISYTEIGDDLEIRTDFGDDAVYLYEVYVGGDADIGTSRGNDWVEMEYTSVDDDIVIDTRNGEDNVEIHEVYGHSLEVETGNDDDNVCAFDSMFDDGARFDLGDGEDGISTNLAMPEIDNDEGPADC